VDRCKGVILVLYLCCTCVRIASEWCPNGVRMVSEWCQNGVRMVSEWCQNGVRMEGKMELVSVTGDEENQKARGRE
jgi:hypothetical protein